MSDALGMKITGEVPVADDAAIDFAGGWCAPAEVFYDVTAPRGGIRYKLSAPFYALKYANDPHCSRPALPEGKLTRKRWRREARAMHAEMLRKVDLIIGLKEAAGRQAGEIDRLNARIEEYRAVDRINTEMIMRLESRRRWFGR